MDPKNSNILRYIISGLALGIAAIHAIFPVLSIDNVTIIALVVAIVPWFVPFIEYVDIPGVARIGLRNMSNAYDKISEDSESPNVAFTLYNVVNPKSTDRDPEESFIAATSDIENEIETTAEKYNAKGETIEATLENLKDKRFQGKRVLGDLSAEGLSDIIKAGKKAESGVRVDKSAAMWAESEGPKIVDSIKKLGEDPNKAKAA